MRNRKTCAELLMKLGVRLRIGGNIYERRRGEKKTGHGKMPKEQWMKCTLRMCCWEMQALEYI